MVHDECHPDVSLSYWEAFRNQAPPNFAEKVLDRSATRLPNWYVPLARGAMIPSSYLMRRAGYRSGSYRARGWLRPNYKELFKDVGRIRLIVLKCGTFWRITRDIGAWRRPHQHMNFALVHIFGSTPVLTRTYQEATYLAEFCSKGGRLPAGLCWVHECPDEMDDAIDFALQRAFDEARAALGQGPIRLPRLR
jgi:hypothetical protein